MQVEIWSDIACPWCYVGKRRFEAALAEFEHRDEVRVTWRSFELDPSAPREREGDRAAHLAEKYATTRERADEMHRHMTDAAAHGAQDALKERLFRAHFTEGELPADHETLERLAVEVGLPADEVREVLASDRYATDVRADESTATALGITAVPFFVVDRAIGAVGAQPSEVLRELLEEGWE